MANPRRDPYLTALGLPTSTSTATAAPAAPAASPLLDAILGTVNSVRTPNTAANNAIKGAMRVAPLVFGPAGSIARDAAEMGLRYAQPTAEPGAENAESIDPAAAAEAAIAGGVGGAGGVLGQPPLPPGALTTPAAPGELPKPDTSHLQSMPPQRRAFAVGSLSDMQINADDYLERPPGEEVIEQFALREIAVLGDKTPAAIQQLYGQIQRNKHQRIQERAKAITGAIKSRYNMDAQAGMQSFSAQERFRRDYLDKRHDANMKAFEAHIRVFQQNSKKMSDSEVRIRTDKLREYRSGISQLSRVRDDLEAYRIEAERLSKIGLGYQGHGAFSNAVHKVSNYVNANDSMAFHTLQQRVTLDRILEIAKGAGTRAVDAAKESARVVGSVPGPGSSYAEVAAYVEAMQKIVNTTEQQFIDAGMAFDPNFGKYASNPSSAPVAKY